MVTVIARMKMKEGKEDDAVRSVTKMAEAVAKNEPGALAYVAHRSVDNPSEIIFFEVYQDEDAFKAHRQTPHMGEMGASFAELFDVSTLKIERLERLAGAAKA
jgi:quinol monooxygenase YgiN